MNRPVFLTGLGFLVLAPCILQAQAPPPTGGTTEQPGGGAPPPPSARPERSPAQDRPGQGESSFLGGDMPFFDPASETISWDGRIWNVNNNRVFQARFERYLNEPEEVGEIDLEYDTLLQKILDLLHPARINSQSMDEAFRMLVQASEFQRDARICDAIANQVHSATQATKNRAQLTFMNRALEEERKRLEWNSGMAARPSSIGSAPRNETAAREWRRDRQLERDTKMAPYLTRLAEVNANLKANELKKELSALQARLEFQSLLVQLFFQRRFQHVLIGTRFYRSIFQEGEGTLQVGEDAKDLFSKTSGMPPTLSTLEAVTSEAIQDVSRGVDAFLFMLEQKELEGATKRLAETFILGEYMPEIRTLPREKKREALQFVRTANQLTAAIESRDYTKAEALVEEMEANAKDFDTGKVRSGITAVRSASAMHLAKARSAAVSGDQTTFEAELREAAELWPGNPALREVAETIMDQGDIQQRAILDFDQLYSQKNYRQIYDDRLRFIAATSIYPDRAETLKTVLEQIAAVEGAIMRAEEIERRGDPAGAWESAERAHQDFEHDTRLNSVRADLTTKAAEFVSSLRKAEDLEKRGQLGSSLAWYLQAQQTYPPSDFAREGIDRIIPKIFPED